MATNIQTEVSRRRGDGTDPAEANRQRWLKASDGLAEGEPLGAPGTFVRARSPQQRAAAVAPATVLARPAAATPAQPKAAQRGRAVAMPPRRHARLGLYALLALLVLLFAYLVVSSVLGWLHVTLDDIQYGRPRTTQIDAFVGHAGEQAGMPSHFIAMNLDRRVVIVELPGGNTAGATTLSGPYLFGDGEQLAPLHLSVRDVNGDGDPDLLLAINDEQLVYINERAQNTFRLMTPTEHAALLNSAARGGSAPESAEAGR